MDGPETRKCSDKDSQRWARSVEIEPSAFVQWGSEIIRPPRSAWQNGYVERLIGSIGREALDHLIVFSEAHLRQILSACASY